MNIERIDENKIRFTLSREEVEESGFEMEDLIRGGDKAKDFITEMMLRASRELGFEVSTMALSVETIVSKDRDELILVITRVSREKAAGMVQNDEEKVRVRKPLDESSPVPAERMLFCFDSISDVIRVADLVREIYQGRNSLFKDERYGKLYLFVERSGTPIRKYNSMLSITLEFAKPFKTMYLTEAFLSEHYTLIHKNDALQVLSQL